jgi:amino acid permease
MLATGMDGRTLSDKDTSILVVGAGVLAMPLAMSHMGITLGIAVIIWSGIAAGFGLYLQSRCARYLDRGSASFFALSQITYPNASVIFDAAIAIKCFGVAVSYLIIIGDLMPGVIEGFVGSEFYQGFLTDRHFWITAFMYGLTTELQVTFFNFTFTNPSSSLG